LRATFSKSLAAVVVLASSSCAASNTYDFDPSEFISTSNKSDKIVITASNMEFQDISTSFSVSAFLHKKGTGTPSSVTMHFRSLSQELMLRLPERDRRGKPIKQVPQQLELMVEHRWYKFPFDGYRSSLRGTASNYRPYISEDVDIFMSIPAFTVLANSDIGDGRLGLLGLSFNDKKQAILKEVSDKINKTSSEIELEFGSNNDIDSYEL
jgi:hypothetical protein